MNKAVKKFLAPRFDPVIHLGHVLTLVSFLAVAMAFGYNTKVDILTNSYHITSLDTAVSRLVATVDVLAKKSISDARQDEKLNAIDTRLNNMEHRLDQIGIRK